MGIRQPSERNLHHFNCMAIKQRVNQIKVTRESHIQLDQMVKRIIKYTIKKILNRNVFVLERK